MSTYMDINRIMKILPHRYPFLMIDRITEFDPGARVCGFKNITVNENVFNGHFPKRPIFPGVLIIEAMAQVGGLLFMKAECDGNIDESDLVFICGVDKVKFIHFVVPGDKLEIECVFEEEFGNLLKIRGTAKVDGKTTCKAEITYAKTVQQGVNN
jgi:3-hydroxyacyl-[acyl-carrier-protein] dehydratase